MTNWKEWKSGCPCQRTYWVAGAQPIRSSLDGSPRKTAVISMRPLDEGDAGQWRRPAVTAAYSELGKTLEDGRWKLGYHYTRTGRIVLEKGIKIG